MLKMTSAILLLTSISAFAGSDIVLSKRISKQNAAQITKDLNRLKEIKFSIYPEPRIKEVMGISLLNSDHALDWLHERVNYIIEEDALKSTSLLFGRRIFLAQDNVEFPNQNIIPYSMGSTQEFLESENENQGHVVMSNMGGALYLGGKQNNQIIGLKISRGFLHFPIRAEVTSPRVGIIQIGEGLFSPDLTINLENPDALSNSIFRLGTFFHEARHSDGNGKSLIFAHATCPAGHDYEGAAACDDNLNGPYTVGTLMINEMRKTCTDETCSARENEVLKMIIIDNASRILTTTSKGEAATNWDATPESL